jgi:hypothetical protein
MGKEITKGRIEINTLPSTFLPQTNGKGKKITGMIYRKENHKKRLQLKSAR